MALFSFKDNYNTVLHAMNINLLFCPFNVSVDIKLVSNYFNYFIVSTLLRNWRTHRNEKLVVRILLAMKLYIQNFFWFQETETDSRKKLLHHFPVARKLIYLLFALFFFGTSKLKTPRGKKCWEFYTLQWNVGFGKHRFCLCKIMCFMLLQRITFCRVLIVNYTRNEDLRK